MIFGDKVTPAESMAAAEWIAPACQGADWTVVALIPNQYPLSDLCRGALVPDTRDLLDLIGYEAC